MTGPVDLSRATFLRGAAKVGQLLPDVGVEVAFAGRSNAGKSSAINALTASKALARISKTPGRTREINFFRVDELARRRLVDLPGYGYAKVPRSVKQHWVSLVEGYFAGRRSLHGVVVIMDVRRPFTELDLQMLGWCARAQLAVHVLLTKADKLSRGRAAQVLDSERRRAARESWNLTLQLFSATRGLGLDEARRQIGHWLLSD